MKLTCEYCGNYIKDTEEVCSVCGAPNTHLKRSGDGIPKTIEELKAFCEAKKIPLDRMRFFLGEDYREPRAFGIFRDAEGNYTVYKNKADGTRIIRYCGTDEAYAVNELYQKLRSEVTEQKAHRPNAATPKNPTKSKRVSILIAVIVGIIAMLALNLICFRPCAPDNGYYGYDGDYYYHQNGSDWYRFDDDTNLWIPSSIISDDLEEHWSDYKLDDSEWNDDYTDFEDSDYWDNNSSDSEWDSDWDDNDFDWDYDYDSWDSGYTDWGSDW